MYIIIMGWCVGSVFKGGLGGNLPSFTCFSHLTCFFYQVLRVGLMGCNSSKVNVDLILGALKDALKHCHKSKV